MSIFFYILTVFSLFFALGRFNPLYKYLYYLPLFKSFRYPGRILILLVFSLAVNAGFGYKALLEKTGLTRKKIAIFSLRVFG